MADLSGEVAALGAELRALGCFERPFLPFLARWLAFLLLACASLAGCVLLPGLWWKAAAFAVSTWAVVALATLGHTAAHGGAADGKWANRILYYATYPFLIQLSARYWTWSHVKVHHPAPNLVGVDLDCDLRPLFAVNQQHARGRRHVWLQGLLLPLTLPFNGFNIQRQGWARLLTELTTPELRSAAAWADLAVLLLHLAVWLVLPSLLFPPLHVLGFYALRVAAIGCVLFAVLAPGHFPAAAACLDQGQREAGDHWLRQLACTANFRTGPLGRLLCSGLDQQIEHHLFPAISHLRLPRARGPVREFCRRNGLPYHELGWAQAIWESYRVFWRPKPVVADVETLRARPAEGAARAG